jgi:hypothetical protein
MDDPALAEVIRSHYSAGLLRLLCSHPKTRMQPSTWQPRYSERLPSEARTKAARNVLVRNWRPQSAARSLPFQRLPTTKRNEILYMPIPIAIDPLEEMKRQTGNYHQKVRTY